MLQLFLGLLLDKLMVLLELCACQWHVEEHQTKTASRIPASAEKQQLPLLLVDKVLLTFQVSDILEAVAKRNQIVGVAL